MDELFPATRLVTIKNAGHWVHSEQPEIFTETLRRSGTGRGGLGQSRERRRNAETASGANTAVSRSDQPTVTTTGCCSGHAASGRPAGRSPTARGTPG